MTLINVVQIARSSGQNVLSHKHTQNCSFFGLKIISQQVPDKDEVKKRISSQYFTLDTFLLNAQTRKCLTEERKRQICAININRHGMGTRTA